MNIRSVTLLITLSLFPTAALSTSAAVRQRSKQGGSGITMKQKNTSHRAHKTTRRRPASRRVAPTVAAEGILIEDESGSVISESSQHVTFNPASTLKLATALYALRRFGPDYQIETTRHGKPLKGRLVDVLKVMLCFSDNGIAEQIGTLIGGPKELRSMLLANERLEPNQLAVASTSGLGGNRITPLGMMTILRALEAELGKHKLRLSNILPVAGVDPGTLLRRYEGSAARGSIVAKTGTLIETDGGASALVGEARTTSGGTLYFVIFHLHGNVPAMRAKQDEIIASAQNALGGPSAFDYFQGPLLTSPLANGS